MIKHNGTKCTLKCAESGKDLASLVNFGHGDLESGDQLTIAGREIEIDRKVTLDQIISPASKPAGSRPKPQARPFRPLTISNTASSSKVKSSAKTDEVAGLGPAKASTFYAKPAPKDPERHFSAAKPSGLINPGQGRVPHPRFDPSADGAIVMKRPDEDHQRRFNRHGRAVVDVVIDPHLSKALRPHQVEGVKFMYERVMGMHADEEKGQGVILADEMGLGKTLQTIALILTLMRQNCYYTPSSCTIERALIVCPLSLVKNWKREFRKWIGNNSLSILCIDGEGRGREDVERFVRSKAYQVLVIGYEKLRTCVKILKDAQPPIGLIVCDEGHRLKSRDTKTTKMFQELSTPRRIILSGTPIQNDLSEFYAMIDFVVPGLLGDYPTFKKVFEDPIIRSRAQHCPKQVRELGQSRSSALIKVTQDIILRRTADLLAKYLQPKHEMVVFCSPSKLQLDIYRSILDSSAVRSVLHGESGNGLLQIGILRKLCNSPELLLKDLETSAESATKELLGDVVKFFPPERTRYEAAYSGKFVCALELMNVIRQRTDDKVIFVSNFTSTLDIMEGILRKARMKFVRLDGRTPQDERMDIVSDFNREGQTSSFVFLLSAKSGGVGLNLIGANRLILFDSDWNPSTDQQAMARIHRDGQKKPCYIYRMLLSGTMDEKIYQRQLSKIGLSDALMNANGADSTKKSSDAFTQEELKDIFTLHTDTTCLSHKQLVCDCDGAGGGSEAAKLARRRAAETESSYRDSPASESDSDDEMPGFMAASQHIANAAMTASRNQRKKLAALHDWGHYDCMLQPDSFKVDEMISVAISQQHRSDPRYKALPRGQDDAAVNDGQVRIKKEATGFEAGIEADDSTGPQAVKIKAEKDDEQSLSSGPGDGDSEDRDNFQVSGSTFKGV